MNMRFKSPGESEHVCQIRSLVVSPVQGATEHWPKGNRQLKLGPVRIFVSGGKC